MKDSIDAPGALKSATYKIEPMAGSRKLIIFFSATGAKPNQFNFHKEGMKLPCHRMFINNGHNEWYQRGVPRLGNNVEETVETIWRWAEHLGADEIYTCGGSMGAYAAILYGTMLGARVLSFAAETTLGIEGSRSVSHIRKGTELRFPELAGYIADAKKPVFHYAGELDPIDVYCATKLKGTPNLTITTLRGVDHNPPRYIRDVGLLPDFLDQFLHNKPMPKTPVDGIVLQKEGFADLFLSAFQSYKRKDWENVIPTGKAALEILPTSEYCHFLVAYALQKLGRTQDALLHISTAKALAYENTEVYPEILLVFASCIRSIGYPSHAVELYQAIIAVDENNHRAHFGLGLSLSNLSEKTEAKLAFSKAYELSPKNPNYAKKAGRVITVSTVP
ncbi:hypothetical protein OIU34_02285 [Pararhizobium sp. BT-229]|uniref:hypothetical protein n=1 Tax=Pararhizobium sp. BT-229 TaxID=2986923 RepID=UPI0021F77834|nr:hypothetical protein [Pararhizobium sp. BT-229]MCV9960715.1 hypothetical protein [Pararhizobium sp. BT-229]